MADLTIRERLWNDFSAVAKKRHKRPETLAQELIQEYIQRVSDEDLLEASAAIARRAPFRIDETEQVIRTINENALVL